MTPTRFMFPTGAMSNNHPLFCPEGGLLVGGNGIVPEETWERDVPGVSASVGCNRLQCAACGEAVRQQAGLALRGDNAADLVALGESDDWSELAFTEPDADSRLYACRCTVWVETVPRRLDSDDFDPLVDPRLPWACGGHPAPPDAHSIDGVEIGLETDLDALVRRVLSGWLPSRSPEKNIYCDWLIRAYHLTRSTPWGDPLSRAVGRCVAQEDAGLRGGAFRFFERHPRASGFEGVVALAAGDDTGLTRSAVALRRGTKGFSYELVEPLAARLREAGSVLDALDRRVLHAMQEALIRPIPGLAQSRWSAWPRRAGQVTPIMAVRRVADEWLAENAAEIARANPMLWDRVLGSLSGRDELVAVAGVALARARVVKADALRRWCEGYPRSKRPYSLVILRALEATESQTS